MPISLHQDITTMEVYLITKMLDCEVVDHGNGDLVITPLSTVRRNEAETNGTTNIIPFEIKRQAE